MTTSAEMKEEGFLGMDKETYRMKSKEFHAYLLLRGLLEFQADLGQSVVELFRRYVNGDLK